MPKPGAVLQISAFLTMSSTINILLLTDKQLAKKEKRKQEQISLQQELDADFKELPPKRKKLPPSNSSPKKPPIRPLPNKPCLDPTNPLMHGCDCLRPGFVQHLKFDKLRNYPDPQHAAALIMPTSSVLSLTQSYACRHDVKVRGKYVECLEPSQHQKLGEQEDGVFIYSNCTKGHISRFHVAKVLATCPM